jgi:hypothetical protein
MKKIALAFTKIAVIGAALSVFAPLAAAQDDDFPPPEVVATLTPVYYEGHASYWWHNRWHYRDAHGAWGRYQAEPQVLHDHRYGQGFDRHYYAGGHQEQHGGGHHR